MMRQFDHVAGQLCDEGVLCVRWEGVEYCVEFDSGRLWT